MEEVAVVITVANEGVSAAVAEAGIIDGPADFKLFLEHVLPVGERIIIAALEAGVTRIGKIAFDGIGYIPRVGAAATG